MNKRINTIAIEITRIVAISSGSGGPFLIGWYIEYRLMVKKAFRNIGSPENPSRSFCRGIAQRGQTR